jgi:hypothetical protein
VNETNRLYQVTSVIDLQQLHRLFLLQQASYLHVSV